MKLVLMNTNRDKDMNKLLMIVGICGLVLLNKSSLPYSPVQKDWNRKHL
jgi:hypothetical protein